MQNYHTSQQEQYGYGHGGNSNDDEQHFYDASALSPVDQQQYRQHQQTQHQPHSPHEYSYPPLSAQSAASNNSQMNLSPNDHLMSASIDRAETFHSAHSDTTYTPSAISPVDEKPGMSQIELNKTSPTLREGYEDLPPAVPRFPNANGGHGRPSSQFTPGHISRGSIALQAAAEGKIPKKEGLKMWRSDEHHGTFTRGGRAKTCLRCTCCTVICAFILIVGVCAAFLLWVSSCLCGTNDCV